MTDWADDKARGLGGCCAMHDPDETATALREAEQRGYRRGVEDAAHECAVEERAWYDEARMLRRADGRRDLAEGRQHQSARLGRIVRTLLPGDYA